MTDYEALARAHMVQQVRETAVLQAALGAYWDRTLSPADFDGSYARFEPIALRIVNAGRLRGELSAQQYYAALAELAALGPAVTVPAQPLASDGVAKSLQSSSVAVAKARVRDGRTGEAALTVAKAAMLRSAKRHVLNAGRQRLLDLSAADPNMRGWARVSDGAPCAFCAMLVSRGPVYTAQTGAFKSHDGCGCSARPIPLNDPTGGWSRDARALRALWDSKTPDGQLGSYDWRKTYSEALADPESHVAKALQPLQGELGLAA